MAPQERLGSPQWTILSLFPGASSPALGRGRGANDLGRRWHLQCGVWGDMRGSPKAVRGAWSQALPRVQLGCERTQVGRLLVRSPPPQGQNWLPAASKEGNPVINRPQRGLLVKARSHWLLMTSSAGAGGSAGLKAECARGGGISCSGAKAAPHLAPRRHWGVGQVEPQFCRN